MKSEKDEQFCYLVDPKMEKFFEKRRENEALMWIPVECSMLFCDELRQLGTTSRYLYFALRLLCGVRGSFEIPLRINYLASTLGLSKRVLNRGIDELIGAKMLHQRERKKEKREEKSTDSTDRQKMRGENASAENAASVVCDFSKSAESEAAEIPKNENAPKSRFSIEECLRYVEICQSKGEEIRNAKGLANHLHKTGEADVFISGTLFPERQTGNEREIYGAPREFSADACRVCFGAKMSDADGKGYRRCENCRDEKGSSTGFEPKT